ncbi:MAG: FtsQ-type POTRA domain-containing protein [Candidatus Peribacteraceae bacterium]|jgi:hypothetical protein|nr:FtsQ-type POTRA domain-containing protein [Candidatus Peribacteraceae bacterium]
MERKKKRSKERWRRLTRRLQVLGQSIRASAIRFAMFGCILVGILVFGFLLFSPIVQVREIEVTRISPRLDIEEVQKSLTPMFNRHMFFLSSFEVAALLDESIPDIESVTIGKTYPSTLHVEIELHPLVARLRILDPDVEDFDAGTGATIDFLTDKGIYVATTAARDTSTLPEIILVDWGVRPQPGDMLLQPTILERINAAEIAFLRQFGKDVQRRTVYLRAREFHLLVDGITIWFDLKSPLEDQMKRYRTFLREVGLEGITQYIDIRVEGRVLYQ